MDLHLLCIVLLVQMNIDRIWVQSGCIALRLFVAKRILKMSVCWNSFSIVGDGRRQYQRLVCVFCCWLVRLRPHSFSTDQITCYPSSQTLCTAAVGTAWSLLGSPRNGQAALYLFQKHILCCKYIRSFSHCGRFWNGYKTPHGVAAVLFCLPALPVHPCAND
jgi:hypothetical protein